MEELQDALGSSSIICDWRLALGVALKCFISVAKGLKLKVRKFLGSIPTFV